MNQKAMISIVVPVYNQAHLTERCLESLLLHSVAAREIIVTDNNSIDTTPELLVYFKSRFEQQGWRFQIITNSENRGFGRACNQGIRATQGEYVVVLNNDTWVMPRWDIALLKLAQDLGADMVGPHYDETVFDAVLTPKKADQFVLRNRGKFARDWVSILMFFRRSALEKLSLLQVPGLPEFPEFFDERFFVTYEDTDLRERMDRARMRYFKSGDCSIWHFSKGTRETQSLPQGYEQEGLRLFIEKWGFDPRLRESTFKARLLRRWKKIKVRFGLF